MKYAFAAGLMFVILAGSARVWSQEPTPISADRLIDWQDASDPPLVLDVRGRQAYLSGSLPGAFDAGIDPLGYLPDHSGDPVVLITAEAFAPMLVESWTARLINAGHKVWLLSGGMAAWLEAGGRIEMPDSTYSRPGRVPFLIPKGLCEGGEPAQVFE